MGSASAIKPHLGQAINAEVSSSEALVKSIQNIDSDYRFKSLFKKKRRRGILFCDE